MAVEPACPDPAVSVPACRNCGATVSGEYCAACGQETRLRLPTARVFLREATGRYVSLDGRLWRTLAALLFRPGFLTREYLEGRRRRYVRPARLFLMLSLAVFAAIRLFGSAPVLFVFDEVPGAGADAASGAKSAAKPAVEFEQGEDGVTLRMPELAISVDPEWRVDFPGADSALARDLKKPFEHFNQLTRQQKSEQVFLGVVRYGPYAMFVLLPSFALLQMIAYVGRARRYPGRPSRYAEHLVFAAHTHAFLFLAVVLALAIPLEPVRVALGVWCVLYGFRATKAVYRGRWMGLFARSLFIGTAYLVLFALVVSGLLLVAVLVR